MKPQKFFDPDVVALIGTSSPRYADIIENALINIDVCGINAVRVDDELKVGITFKDEKISHAHLKMLENYYQSQGWGSLTYEYIAQVDHLKEEFGVVDPGPYVPDYDTVVWLHYWNEPQPPMKYELSGYAGAFFKPATAKRVWWVGAALFVYTTVLHFI